MMPSVSRQSHQCLDTDGFGEYGAVFFFSFKYHFSFSFDSFLC